MIEFTQGNILQSDCDVIVNPVNCVGVMGKGLALAFKKAYPEMFEDYVQCCHRGFSLGDLHEWPTGNLVAPKIILNFPTKGHWRDASVMEDVTLGLKRLHRWLKESHARSIAIPALGCGLGGLEWETVKAKIVEILFLDADLANVRIVLYEPR